MKAKSDFVDALDNLKPSVTFDQVWGVHTNRFLNKRKKKSAGRFYMTWITSGVAGMLILTLLLSPSVRASINTFIDTHIVNSESDAVVYEGWASSRKWDTATSYSSLHDAEQAVGQKLPFPLKVLKGEPTAMRREMSVTTEKGDVVGYYYSIRTSNRMVSITANYRSTTSPHFNFNTTDAVSDKVVYVNGVPVHLISVKEFDGYWIYIFHGEWKIVIEGFNMDNSENAGKIPLIHHFTEREALSIVKSIQW
ncbi:hypothetical protein A8990_12727 [Paenibacillus taihuensis]|uniref:DUF4367 domain-containing protein n=1 Tax=Paenibacillus taihuensis TaxID=1156355 RepID=A0A3D9RH89_9BACL|nr:hypothetical protein [Paenibacillus taihuensis]REE77707.1 hypothetical protein A8990_12727 [Paenibacillus taihuensis]